MKVLVPVKRVIDFNVKVRVKADQSGVDLQWAATLVSHGDEVGALGVVHFDASVEAARELGMDEQLEVAMPGLAAEPCGDEERLPLERRPRPVELAHSRRKRGPAWIPCRAGNRERRWLDDDCRPRPSRDERLERLTCQREAKRVPNGCRHVCYRLARGRRSEHDVLVGRFRDDESRPVRQGEPRH